MDPETRPPTSADGSVAPAAATIRLVHDLRSLCGHEAPLALLFDEHMRVATAGSENCFAESSAHLSAAGNHGRNPIEANLRFHRLNSLEFELTRSQYSKQVRLLDL